LGFWLPNAYRAATAPVACLFAIMTKVGVYAILRVHLMIYADTSGPWTSLAEPWLLPLGLVTVALGTLGLLAASALRTLVAYLVVISVGTLIAGVGLFTRDAIAASLFYLVHSTLVTGGLFLLADLVARQRGAADDRLEQAQAVVQPAVLGTLFFAGAVAIAGLPPASGFITKLLLLQAAVESPHQSWVWGVVLGAGLLTIVSLARAGSALFWRTDGTRASAAPLRVVQILPSAVLIASAAVLVIVAGRMNAFTAAAADQLLNPGAYVEAVLANEGVSIPASAAGTRP
jgi:multicomponent K+:H+ antiporter subunit D